MSKHLSCATLKHPKARSEPRLDNLTRAAWQGCQKLKRTWNKGRSGAALTTLTSLTGGKDQVLTTTHSHCKHSKKTCFLTALDHHRITYFDFPKTMSKYFSTFFMDKINRIKPEVQLEDYTDPYLTNTSMSCTQFELISLFFTSRGKTILL